MFLAGCATNIEPEDVGVQKEDEKQKKQKVSAQNRHINKQRNMIGSTRDELIQKFGKPDAILDSTLKGRPRSEAYVYPEKNNCIDAFVVIEETGEVNDYFCRWL